MNCHENIDFLVERQIDVYKTKQKAYHNFYKKG